MNTYEKLGALAENLWWSWNPEILDLFERLDRTTFRNAGNNPVAVLQTLSPKTTFEDNLASDIDTAHAAMTAYLEAPCPVPHAPRTSYFCMEFGIHESLPIYAGGLGILAGDHAKAASDLCIPFTAIGLFLQQGYFEQHFTEDGWQQERYPALDPENHPLELVCGKDGNPSLVTVHFGNQPIRIQAWRAQIGRTILYLLDTRIEDNPEEFRNIANRLYQGGRRTRLQQEIVLGVGGVRLLRALGVETDVYHMNEGHCAFLSLELLREQLDLGKSREEAVRTVRDQCVFTTHTPVLAGHDRFDPGMFLNEMSALREELDHSERDLMAYGRVEPDNPGEWFTMTVLGLNMSRNANGVSQRNGHVAQRQWHPMFPDRRVQDVPIGAITNGIHVATWAAPIARAFLNEKLGDWKKHADDLHFWRGIDDIPDEVFWEYRNELRRQLIRFAAEHTEKQSLSISCELDPDALTLGFARRFATYKRAPLLFTDIERTIALFTNPDRPIQIVYAGKSHPEDEEGKQFIRQILEAAQRPGLQGRIVFLENYNMRIGRMLTSGCDVWLNNPRSPMEASGTSGQKVAVHGGLNLSVLDGWWPEGYNGENGWAIGHGYADGSFDKAELDRRDAESLYRQLEQGVVPAFYERDERGIPTQWIGRMRAAMKELTPRFSATRMVKEYAERMYRVTDKSDSDSPYIDNPATAYASSAPPATVST